MKSHKNNKINLGTISFFCDESCHLDNDNASHMAIASVYCRKDRKKGINQVIKAIKTKYKITTELKWNKVSNSTLEMYKDIFTFIKNYRLLKIRIVVSNKSKINQSARHRWYDTMYYKLLEFPMQSILWDYDLDNVDIYSDIKDTRSAKDMIKVCNFLDRHFKNKTLNPPKFNSKVCDSNDVILIQIADLLAGASTFKNRGLINCPNSSKAKSELVKHIENCFKINLSSTTKTRFGELSPYNVFIWDPEVKDESF